MLTAAALLVTATSLFLGGLVFLKNWKRAVNRIFALLCFSIAIWGAGYFAWQTATQEQTALLFARTLMAGAIFIPILHLHFVIEFLKQTQQKKLLLTIGYAVFGFFFFANFTPLFIQGVAPKEAFLFWPEPGILFHPFLVMWAFYAALAIGILFLAKRRTQAFLQEQINYLLFASIIGYAGGTTNYLLWYDIPIPPIGMWLVPLFVGIIGYAIITKHLFEIRVILTELLVGSIAILLFIQFLTAQTPFEYAWKGALFSGFLFFGWLLVKSVLREIRHREELAKAYRELQKLDEAKSGFISLVSHQLRTPLTAIKGYTSLLQEGVGEDLSPKYQKMLQRMYDSNERIIRLVNDILNVSRIETGKIKAELQPTNIEQLIKSVVGELAMKAREKKIKLAFSKPKTELPEIKADAPKIRNAVLNLIDNAIRYTEKGSITVTADRIPSKNPKRIRIAVRDTGAGMNKEELSGLFQSFTRGTAGLKTWTEGAGLGLYIAKQFVEMHGGKIWAESKGKGKGSVFFIELPIE